MPGHPDWQGTAITHGITTILSQTLSMVANGNANTGTPTAIDKPGYLIQVTPTFNAASSEPFTQITMRWYAEDQSTVIWRTDWIVAGNTAGNLSVMGQGPVRGTFLQVTATNLDTAHAATCAVRVLTCSHDIARDDWRSFPSQGTIPSFTMAPGNNPTFGVLISDQPGLNFPAGTTTYLLPLYDGVMSLSMQANTANVTVAVFPAATGGNEFSLKLAALTPVNNQLVPLSRQPHVVQVINTGTSAATGWIIGVMLDYAS